MFHKINKPIHQVTLLDCPDPFKNKVKCEECKHWVDKTDASVVSYSGSFGYYYSYFCSMHKKPYTRTITAFPRNLFFGEVLMEQDGTPVGYEKIKEPKNEN